ncbi:MAG: hypothetical protein IPO77_10040 [Acidobacteria bacterium]|nr:hypothetical protein [Acidobacteriota bacterium]
MLAPINAQTAIRPIGLAVPPIQSDICVGVPSCAPLIQHELLKTVRHQIPHAYARAERELGLSISRTHELIERRVEIISAAKAIRLARLIAYEPNATDVFDETGRNVLRTLNNRFPGIFRNTVRSLPRSLRSRMALAMTRHVANSFAGSFNHIITESHKGGVLVTIDKGVFSDRLDTLNCAQAYYRQVFETMLQQVAFVDCEVSDARRSRTRLNSCNLSIVWEA